VPVAQARPLPQEIRRRVPARAPEPECYLSLGVRSSERASGDLQGDVELDCQGEGGVGSRWQLLSYLERNKESPRQLVAESLLLRAWLPEPMRRFICIALVEMGVGQLVRDPKAPAMAGD